MTGAERRRFQRLARTVARKAFTLSGEIQEMVGDDYFKDDLWINASEAALASDEVERLLKDERT